jgi:hypothetical protein
MPSHFDAYPYFGVGREATVGLILTPYPQRGSPRLKFK